MSVSRTTSTLNPLNSSSKNRAPPHERAGWRHPRHRGANPTRRLRMPVQTHASRAPHLKRQACSTRRLMTLGSDRALAFARSRTNVLRLRGPSTADLPSQHNQPCSGLAAHKLRISAFFPSACDCQRCTIHTGKRIERTATTTRRRRRNKSP